ncbi:MAG: AAA family ATPase [Planctomycetaceae bacterium]|nr:AAA family ATPase [Planctomycetaceae bacterium]
MSLQDELRLSQEQLRWQCDPSLVGGESEEQSALTEPIGVQQTARDAMTFGILCDAPGQNVFVRGARGTGRRTMVKQLLTKLAPTTGKKRDFCYVHHFKNPDRPRLITLSPGSAKAFRRQIHDIAKFIQDGLVKALDSEPFASERMRMKAEVQVRIAAISEPLEKDLAENSMALVSIQQGNMSVPVIFPLVDGQPVKPEEFQALIKEGKASSEQLDKFKELFPGFQNRLKDIGKQVNETYREGQKAIEAFNERGARSLFYSICEPVVSEFGSERGVAEFLSEIVDDAIEYRLNPSGEEKLDLTDLYGVNIVLTHEDKTKRPVVEESLPSAMNLLGTVEQKIGPSGTASTDYRGIRAGALLNADQGYLILNTEDLLSEPGAWHALMRTLRTGRLEIVPPEAGWMRPYVVVQPEPIEIQVRVILIGDVSTYYRLDHSDTDFGELFKVLADFEHEMPRDQQGVKHYAEVLSQLVSSEGLLPFDNSAVAALAEHGARIVSRGKKLTTRFGRIADIAREAAFVCQQMDEGLVTDKHVEEAVRRTKRRASLPSKNFQEMVERGTILVECSGEVVGQINGLAVMRAGPLTYGFPARITASIGPGRAGLINIEGTASMSGSIHTKGFHILGGLLRFLLKTSHPLAFSASIAFEQSYGGIDGDSASGAEMVCLLSALTAMPIRQGMAMTGAVDQHGHIQAIGGVNEKIEGFFDVCVFFGLTGEQGVVIPKSNAADLMLRSDVVEACAAGKFHIYAVDTIHQAMELMTGIPAGDFVEGIYPVGSLLAMAVEKAHEYWRLTLASPAQMTRIAGESEEVGDAENQA